MRIEFFALLILLITGARLVLGEQFDAISQDSAPKENLHLGASDKTLARDGVNVKAETFGLWISAETLLWWLKSGDVPPLVTAGGNGVIGSPGTQVSLDDLNFVDDFRQGGRFVVGYRFESNSESVSRPAAFSWLAQMPRPVLHPVVRSWAGRTSIWPPGNPP